MNAQAHPTFEFLRSQAIESLRLVVEEYRHRKTGAQHIHIAADNPENVFLVALRTVPEDSTGVAHILEHTALCGSEKYPVRDPFFMMIRRSLNTFMNAFTSSDWTAYPFASQNRKDFDNLMDIYLDAVFFSRLDELDFCQEGHRLEFTDPADATSPLVYKGVVFNEMKGAMSSVTSTLWHTLAKYLYPTTTYHYNSGGDPESIPDLSYAQLVEFYRTHYHPSNAIFMTFGDIPANDHQRKFEAQVLNRFEPLSDAIAVPDEKRYLAPIRVEEAYAFDEGGSDAHRTHVVLGWLLGRTTDLRANLNAHLLNTVLLDNSASPLLQALETSDLGTAPSPLCGLDDSHRELSFSCGLEGSDLDQADAVEELVLGVLREVATDGVPADQVEAALHQLELHQREIGGDGYPYGLQLILTALGSATHRGDPIALLNLEQALAALREDIRDPQFIKNLARELLLDNPHRVRLALRPDAGLSQRRQAAEAAHLRAIEAGLSAADRAAIIERTEALAARQAKPNDASLLPKVGLEDISPALAYVEPIARRAGPLPLTSYGAGTNGLVYQQLVMPLPALTPAQLDLLPLYTAAITEVGVGARDYLATQRWQSQVSGGIHAYATVRCRPDDPQAVTAHLVLSTKGLARHQEALCDLLQQTLEQVRFDELARLRELVAQNRARRDASITGSGHSLAMTAAASGASAGAHLAHRWGGLEGIRLLRRLDDRLDDAAAQRGFADDLHAIHAAVRQAPRQCLLIAETERLPDCERAILGRSNGPRAATAGFTLAPVSARTTEVWTTSTQVNFCARAYPTVAMDHPDAAALNVLGGFLRNGFLHRAIREQGGAYGGGASQDNGIGAFRFYSYRDPRSADTLEDFDQSVRWLLDEKHEWQAVEEAILGVISSIDKPGSPAGEAKQAFHAELSGRSRAKQEAFRNRVRAVVLEDLLRVGATYLTPERASTAVITSADRADALALPGLAVQVL